MHVQISGGKLAIFSEPRFCTLSENWSFISSGFSEATRDHGARCGGMGIAFYNYNTIIRGKIHMYTVYIRRGFEAYIRIYIYFLRNLWGC